MATYDSVNNVFVLAVDEDDFVIPATLPNGDPTPEFARIAGNARANILTGDDSNNYLSGGWGLDRLIGGLGDDRYMLDVDANDLIVENAGGGYDIVQSSFTHILEANVEALYLQGTDNINGFGNNADNDLSGNSGNNLLDGGAGDDFLTGFEGNDSLVGGAGEDYLSGGKGNDSLTGGAGGDEINGGEGDDTIDGGAGDDYITGGDGHDTLSFASATAGVTVSLLKTGGGENLGDRYEGFEDLIGSALADSLTGDSDNNKIEGGAGNDTLDGGGSWDLLEGGAGNDTYIVDHYADVIIDTAGIDTVITKMAAFTLAEGVENLTASGALNFILTGSTTSNAITGSAGADVISGQLGNDVLTGGAGQDHFAFNSKPNKKANVDTIVDFNVLDDTIYLDRGTFSSLSKISKKGAIKATTFKIGVKATDADDRILYDKKKGVLFYDADGNGSGAAVEFAKVAPKTALTHKDFFMF